MPCAISEVRAELGNEAKADEELVIFKVIETEIPVRIPPDGRSGRAR